MNDFTEIFKIFENYTYKNIGFLDMKFFKLILHTIILYMNDFDEF